MIHSREDISLVQRIVIKAGTSVVSTPDGYPSLSRIANIVENVRIICIFYMLSGCVNLMDEYSFLCF
jgi:hypothetical protein